MPDKRERGCDRKVDLARDDDEGHADRDDRHERRLPADVEKIVDRQKPRRREAEDDEQHREGEVEHPRPFAAQTASAPAPRRGPAHQARPPRLVAAQGDPSCRLSLFSDLDELMQVSPRRRIPTRASVAVTRPSTTIEMRSHSRISSLRSDETISAPAPLRRALANEAVDFLARADIDADSRLVEQQDARARVVPFREDDFLLVAAGEIPDAVGRPGRLDRQPLRSPPPSRRSRRRGAPSSPTRNAAGAAG